MKLQLLEQLYRAYIIIDVNQNRVVASKGMAPFEVSNNIHSQEELDTFFQEYYQKENAIPLFDQIKVGDESFWVLRKMIDGYLYYLLQECRYWDAILQKVQKKSIFDGLTNLYNKMEIQGRLQQHLEIYLRYKKSPFAVFMFDIDFFKKVNDTYGHLAGDYVLKEVSALAKSMLRSSDIIGRFGGEEFLVVLPETKVAGALKLADRIRKACEEYTFTFGKNLIQIRLSFGVTSVTKTDSVASLLDRCDTALYDAKKNGRNRVEYR